MSQPSIVTLVKERLGDIPVEIDDGARHAGLIKLYPMILAQARAHRWAYNGLKNSGIHDLVAEWLQETKELEDLVKRTKTLLNKWDDDHLHTCPVCFKSLHIKRCVRCACCKLYLCKKCHDSNRSGKNNWWCQHVKDAHAAVSAVRVRQVVQPFFEKSPLEGLIASTASAIL